MMLLLKSGKTMDGQRHTQLLEKQKKKGRFKVKLIMYKIREEKEYLTNTFCEASELQVKKRK